jgi:hypothetical protein
MNITVEIVNGIDGAEDEIKATFVEGLYTTFRTLPSRNQTKETIDAWVADQAKQIAGFLTVKGELMKEYTFGEDKVLKAAILKA